MFLQLLIFFTKKNLNHEIEGFKLDCSPNIEEL